MSYSSITSKIYGLPLDKYGSINYSSLNIYGLDYDTCEKYLSTAKTCIRELDKLCYIDKQAYESLYNLAGKTPNL